MAVLGRAAGLRRAEPLAHGIEALPVPAHNPHPAEPRLFSVALLLFGYAIEVGLKGLVVQSKAATSVRNEPVSSSVGLLVSQGDQRIYLPGAPSGNVPAADGK